MAEATTTMPVLRVLTGASFGAEYSLSRDRMIVGRELTCAIVLDEPVLSRRHCVVFKEDGQYWLADLESKNGTYLNGVAIEKDTIEDGDVIRIGSTRLEFVSNPAQPRPHKSEFHVRRTTELALGAALDDPLLGHDVDHYRLIEKVGEGGMGSVYRAQDLDTKAAVALKLMSRSVALEPDQVERFKREFETGLNLEHPNIVQVFDFGKFEDTFYLVMEFVEGHQLQDILDVRGRLTLRGAIKVAVQVARALEHAFSQRIIHRDIKPENILITPQGVVKVLDLGLAKRIMEQASGPSITKTGEGIGTLHYMAPEQTVAARDTDQRSDIYALGATLYHMIGGEPPFDAEGIWDFVELIQHAEPRPLTELVENLPEPIWQITKRALEKDPNNRFQVPREFRTGLEDCLKLL